MKSITKPELLEQRHLEFLNTIREIGKINMFCASPSLEQVFGLSKTDARAVLAYWMETFE